MITVNRVQAQQNNRTDFSDVTYTRSLVGLKYDDILRIEEPLDTNLEGYGDNVGAIVTTSSGGCFDVSEKAGELIDYMRSYELDSYMAGTGD